MSCLAPKSSERADNERIAAARVEGPPCSQRPVGNVADVPAMLPMPTPDEVEWDTCTSPDHPDCIGVQLTPGGPCLAHEGAEMRNFALTSMGSGAPIEAVRGCQVSEQLLAAIVGYLPRDTEDRPILAGADFRNTTFTGSADFAQATFQPYATFMNATFSDFVGFDHTVFGHVNFVGARFKAHATFEGSTFTEFASFDGASFLRKAAFGGATFTVASFGDVLFKGTAEFDATTFTEFAGLRRAKFEDGASFLRATLADTSFSGATIEGPIDFFRAIVKGRLIFDANSLERVGLTETRFEATTSLALACGGDVACIETHSTEGLEIDVCASGLDLSGAVLGGPTRINLRATPALAFGVVVRRPLSIDAIPSPMVEAAAILVWFLSGVVTGWASEAPQRKPGVLTLARAVLDDTVAIGSGVDLGGCDLAGVHNLHHLHIGSMTSFDVAPHGGRRVLAVERQWRCDHRPSDWWRPRRWLWRNWDQPPSEVTTQKPHEIEATYRELRVGREAAGDAPGAADLYYGEMEMRRHDPTRSFGERALVWLYWLFGGYGLRVLRPLIALAVLLVACTWLLDAHGFHQGTAPANTFIFALNSALSVLRPTADDVKLQQWGEVALIVLKLGVPLFLGLTLLSIRGRVKR